MSDSNPATLAAQLAEVDLQLGELRQQAAVLRDRNGSGEDGAVDTEERAAATTSALELDAVIAVLQARRERLANHLAGFNHPTSTSTVAREGT